jgi:hypothetical protein
MGEATQVFCFFFSKKQSFPSPDRDMRRARAYARAYASAYG